jgi:hypothetical protein
VLDSLIGRMSVEEASERVEELAHYVRRLDQLKSDEAMKPIDGASDAGEVAA